MNDQSDNANHASPHILITDDSATMRAVIRRTLGMAGFDTDHVEQATNGREAFETVQRATESGQPFDLLLLDLHMPEMTGMELAAKLHEEPSVAGGAKVIVVSSEATDARVEEMFEKGVAGYVIKPFTPEQIRDVAEQALGYSPQAEAA
ncbi:MAG: response regulator [Planctomycetota bacterium]